MKSDEIAEARQHAQQAQSFARLAADDNIKAHWQELANARRKRLEYLEALRDEPAPPASKLPSKRSKRPA